MVFCRYWNKWNINCGNRWRKADFGPGLPVHMVFIIGKLVAGD